MLFPSKHLNKYKCQFYFIEFNVLKYIKIHF